MSQYAIAFATQNGLSLSVVDKFSDPIKAVEYILKDFTDIKRAQGNYTNILEMQDYYAIQGITIAEPIEIEENRALTKKELKEKNGAPIFIVPLLKRNQEDLLQFAQYGLVSFDENDSDLIYLLLLTNHHTNVILLRFSEYGKAWIAFEKSIALSN